MSTVSTKTTDVDNITPDDSASNVSGTTHTSTRYVLEAKRRKAAEAERLEEKHQLEMTIAEIEDENYLAELHEKNQDQLRKVEHEKRRKQKQLEDEEEEIRRLKEEAEKAIETERAARARRRRLRQAEMSMQRFNAMTSDSGDTKTEKQTTESLVSRSTTKVSIAPRYCNEKTENDDQGSLNESLETVKDCNAKSSKAVLQHMEFGVSKLAVGHKTKPSTVKSTVEASFALQNEPATEKKFSSTSIPDRKWINDHLQTLNMSPLPQHEALSSTLQPVSTTISGEIIMRGNGAVTSNAITTSATYAAVTATTRSNLRNYGDRKYETPYLSTHNRQIGYNPYAQPIRNTAPANQSSEIALAIQQLASSNEIASLPKSELLTFDSSSKNYNRFMASFKVNIENKKSIDDTTKLTYLIQYCEGKSRSLIENCIMMNSTEGLAEAKRLLEQEYGKPHGITRSFIDSLIKALAIPINDHDGIIELANYMH